MKYKIHYCGEHKDEIIVEGKTRKNIMEKVEVEIKKRNWKRLVLFIFNGEVNDG